MTAPIVVDASVALKWVIDEPLHTAARQLIALARHLTAPDIIHAEVANVCRKKVRRGELGRAQAVLALGAIRQIIGVVEPTGAYAERALLLALTLDHHAYDCFYLAQAEALGGVLVTADQVLWRKVRAAPLPIDVRVLDDPALAASLAAWR